MSEVIGLAHTNKDEISSREDSRMLPMLRVAGILVILWASLPAHAAGQKNPTGEGFFSSAGVRMRYIDRGSGEPVLLLHGYTGTIERHFVDNGVIPNLQEDYRVIALDLRGHGGSGKPHEPSAYGAEIGQDVIRLLDHLGIRRAHIVGYSLGAHIVAQLLTVNPERFATATLVGSAPWRAWTNERAAALEAAAVELESDLPFRSIILRLTPADQPSPTDEEIRAMSQSMAARNDVRALAAFQRGFRRLVVSDEQLMAVRVPTVGVIGTVDPNFEAMKELKTVMRHLDVVIVDGATHGGGRGVLNRPEFFDAVRRVIRANRIAP